MRLQITPSFVRALWAHLSAEYDSEHARKDDSALMDVVAWGLNLMKIQDKNTFMRRYATTIGSTIYTPYAVGVGSAEWSLDHQVSNCIHEHHHVHQYNTSKVGFAWEYMTKDSARAHYEAEAMRAELEWFAWLYGYLPDGTVERCGERIRPYGCGDNEVAYVRDFIRMSATAIVLGEVSSPVVESAIEFAKTI